MQGRAPILAELLIRFAQRLCGCLLGCAVEHHARFALADYFVVVAALHLGQVIANDQLVVAASKGKFAARLSLDLGDQAAQLQRVGRNGNLRLAFLDGDRAAIADGVAYQSEHLVVVHPVDIEAAELGCKATRVHRAVALHVPQQPERLARLDFVVVAFGARAGPCVRGDEDDFVPIAHRARQAKRCVAGEHSSLWDGRLSADCIVGRRTRRRK